MNEPFGDDPYWHENTEKMGITACRRLRVLALAREMLLNDTSYRTLDQYIIRAEEWIRAEDAYVLPEDMR